LTNKQEKKVGLGFSHGDAHWSYSGFMRFRNKLTETLGYTVPLGEMYYHGSHIQMKNEPIFPLINHSDCDGNLTVEEMQQILPQLEGIINRWDDDDYEKPLGLRFVTSIKEAIEADEPLEFM